LKYYLKLGFIQKELLFMFPIPWYVVLLVSIPESFLVVILGFSLYNLKISYRKALLIAMFGSLGCDLVRLFNTINGVHTLIWATVMIVVTTILSRIDAWKVIVAILTGVTICVVVVSLYSPIYFSLTSTNIHDLQIKPWLNVYFFLPEAFLLSAICVVVNKYRLGFKNEPIGGVNNETL